MQKQSRALPGVDTKEHTVKIKMTKSYLLAYIISGNAGPESDLWPERSPMFLTSAMRTAWTNVTALRNGEVGTLPKEPTEYKARRVYVNPVVGLTFTNCWIECKFSTQSAIGGPPQSKQPKAL